MARKGQKKGLKRTKAPRGWPIARKRMKWTINPHSGPHNREALPLAFILRDYLGYARTLRESKRILNERRVKINGKVRTDFKFPVGILDVVEIPLTNECYRVLPNQKGAFILHPITGEERHMRLLKITGKRLGKSQKIQLGFHDGTSLHVDRKEYATFGTLLYDFESQSIAEYFPFATGSYAMITAGRNVSRTGKITSVRDKLVEIQGEEVFRTLRDYIFVLGTKQSAISLGD
ncbi:MAG: 30S ribosomal protein S4e [Theionarchaea archaeon]|nr:30S ribosomal protein S4e [Theionarchaea archaeon]MBU7036314.1 30S ribosomal protein S4e [Theionarchaea archaeon]